MKNLITIIMGLALTACGGGGGGGDKSGDSSTPPPTQTTIVVEEPKHANAERTRWLRLRSDRRSCSIC